MSIAVVGRPARARCCWGVIAAAASTAEAASRWAPGTSGWEGCPGSVLFAVVLSLFLADVGPPRESEAFARARAGDLAASTRMLSDLLEAHPGSERACLWQERIFLNEAAQGDPDGPHAATAAHVQLSLAASITNHQERERTDLCRSDRDGVCVVEGTSPRGPACFEPTAACLVHLTHPDRWPTAALHGFMIERPIGWAP